MVGYFQKYEVIVDHMKMLNCIHFDKFGSKILINLMKFQIKTANEFLASVEKIMKTFIHVRKVCDCQGNANVTHVKTYSEIVANTKSLRISFVSLLINRKKKKRMKKCTQIEMRLWYLMRL